MPYPGVEAGDAQAVKVLAAEGADALSRAGAGEPAPAAVACARARLLIQRSPILAPLP